MKEKTIKKGITRKLFSGILALAMVFALLPLNKIVAKAASTPLTFTAEDANSSVTFNWNAGSGVEYSMNGGAWSTYSAGTAITLVNVGDKVSFRGSDVKTNSSNHFTMTGKIAASGDVTSLTNGIGGDVALDTECYSYMFYDCTSLTSAPALPSNTLANRCYRNMFRGCTNLVSASALPATTLATGCYINMFFGCTSLLCAPALPATTLPQQCYFYMFYRCTSLSSVPTLPATTLGDSCYESMFEECTNIIVTETTNASEAIWTFPSTVASDWNRFMLYGLTAPGTLTAVEAGKMYKVSYVVPLPTPPASSGSTVDCYDELISQLEAMANRLANGEIIENPTVYFKVGDSLPLKVMQTLKKCAGVTLDFQCTYKEEAYHYSLKGGEGLVIDETISWYGPLFLKCMYGVVDGDNITSTTGVYIIKPGDSLGLISRELGVSVAELLKKNPQIKDPNCIWAGHLLNY